VISFLAANWVTLLLGLLNIACWSQGWFGHPRRGAVMTIGAQVPWTIWDLTHHAAGFLLMTAVVVPVAVFSLWKSRTKCSTVEHKLTRASKKQVKIVDPARAHLVMPNSYLRLLAELPGPNRSSMEITNFSFTVRPAPVLYDSGYEASLQLFEVRVVIDGSEALEYREVFERADEIRVESFVRSAVAALHQALRVKAGPAGKAEGSDAN
jgi:hypothetical protein